jgi:hypothetical protein
VAAKVVLLDMHQVDRLLFCAESGG